MTSGEDHKSALRVARFIRGRKVAVVPAADSQRMLLQDEADGAISASRALLGEMSRMGLVERAGEFITLTVAGRALTESQRTKDAVPEGMGDLALITLDDRQGGQRTLADLSESPLAQLARRRGRDGRPFLETREVNAGERLRMDYTRGQIMQRLGANWIASVASGRRSGGGGTIELTDAALAARMRVEKAIGAVGPELSGVLLDICCYLKGLERVEVERGWPARSAKVVLKSALGALSRHYEPCTGKRRAEQILHWGAEDYRPSLT
ncbi:DUF6456 domain-containing protein [Arvimicrobium flavum]|uniref:DUF6456 domain-containing protein n=1 Tax=Arvimicrobium flavum TaxID=3393320 RepID=UPI00237B2CF3|nr:DUF6456 domain-containing protein [Mesorhizobium shangrilense]